jgi:hypothetical protein
LYEDTGQEILKEMLILVANTPDCGTKVDFLHSLVQSKYIIKGRLLLIKIIYMFSENKAKIIDFKWEELSPQ